MSDPGPDWAGAPRAVPTGAASTRRAEDDQSLALKVMRLYKPRLGEPGLGLGLHGLDTRSWTQGDGAAQLVLPSSFGKIYLGQVFACYISVCPSSPAAVGNVAVSAELEAAGQRALLLDKREANRAARPEDSPLGKAARCVPGQTVDFVIEQELGTIGEHTLRVTVQFDVAGERRSLRKHYRFDVAKPLSFAATFEPADAWAPGAPGSAGAGAARLVAQVEVKNLTKADLLLSQVEMLPVVEGFVARQVAVASRPPAPLLLPAAGSWNFVFQLEPRKAADPGAAPPRLVAPGLQVARVLTKWTTDFGEQGRLISQPLVWKAEARAAPAVPPPAPVGGVADQRQPASGAILVRATPLQRGQALLVGECCPVLLEVTNLLASDITEAELRIAHAPGPDCGVLFVGSTTTSLGALAANQTATAVCDALPLAPGAHALSVSVLDKVSGRELVPATPPSLFVTG
jgi:hypothetical protein